MKVLLVCMTALFLSAGFVPAVAPEPAKISWDDLKDVTFKKKWYAEEQVYMLYPTFGQKVAKFDGKDVIIKGYVIPVDYEGNLYVLSAFPYSMCFFCGGAGPESVMSLKFKKNGKRFKTDEVHTFKGKLKLNASDIYELNYILDGAEQVEAP
ncbi:MAG: DUF3299 domain-containing protein [Spirosomataceae bacterium]